MKINSEDNSLELGIKRTIFNSSMRKIRESKGMTQKELADECGLTAVDIGKIELLKKIPNHDQADSIAESLGVTINEILAPDIYSKLVPKIKDIPDKVYFEVSPLSLAQKEMKQLENTEEDIKEMEREMNARMIVSKYIQILIPKEREVIELRFGLNDGKTKTLEEVGRELGVTRERVRQLEARALRKIKERMKADNINYDNII